MIANFNASLKLVLVDEGGYVDDPRDPGGATNEGVIQSVDDVWREHHDLARHSVRAIDPAEVSAIYKQELWDRVDGDNLPAGIDYAVFDFGVNSGPHKAVETLGRVGGPGKDAARTIDAVCDERLAFMRTLATWPHFGKGWERRVEDVRRAAKAMVKG